MAKENLENVIVDLRKSLAWLDLVLATLNEGVLTLEKDLRIHFANDAMAEILDMNRIFLLGLPLWEALPLSQNGKLLKKKDFLYALTRDDIQSLSGIYNLKLTERSLIVDVSFGNVAKIKQIVVVVRDVTKQQQETTYTKLHQEIASAANESKRFEKTMGTCLELICKYTKWPVGHMYNVNKTAELNPTDIWYLKNPRKFAVFRKITQVSILKRGEGLPGRVLTTGKPAWISDVNQDKNFPRAKQAKEVNIRSGIAFPILIREEVVAVVEFFSTEVFEPNDSFLQVMANIGTQLGRVIERGRSEEERIKLTREQAARAEVEAAKQHIQLSEIRHRTMIEQSPLSMQILSPDGKTLQVNKAWGKLWGATLEQLKDYNMLKDKQLIQLGIMPYIKKGFQGKPTLIPAVRYEPNKTISDVTEVPYRWVRAYIYPVKDKKGTIREVVLVHDDITEQMDTEVKLQESQSNLKFLAEASKILSSSLDYKITLSNIAKAAVPKIADWCAVDILNGKGRLEQVAIAHKDPKKVKWAKELRKTAPPDLNAPTGIPNVIRTGKPEIYPHITDTLLMKVAKNKKHLKLLRSLGFTSAMIVPLYKENTCIGGITFVTTELKRHYNESDLAMAEDLASRASMALENTGLYKGMQDAVILRDNFISIASHELKTPLTSVKIFTQILQKHSEQIGDNMAKNHLEKMDRQLNKLIELIYNMLNISKIQAGRMEFNQKLFDFDRSVKEIVDVLQEGVTKHRLIIKGKTGKKVYGDEDRIGQVLSNLIVNAIKYSPKADKVIIHLSADTNNVTVCVEDFGIGLAKEHLGKIFERFYRVYDTTDKTFPGLGIGLYISSEIVNRHYGKLWVDSHTGKGSKFYFSLPLRRDKKTNRVIVL